MVITGLGFGRMEIDGHPYGRDLILLPPDIHFPWIRHRGHHLCLEDLGTVLERQPQLLVIGTGMFGRMRVDAALIGILNARNIACRPLRTREAAAEFNAAVRQGLCCAGAFHLTC